MMTTPTIIAEALVRAKKAAMLHDAQIIHSKDISRTDREVLVRTGWLQEIIRGWYMLVRPDVATGDTAAWYANFWDFIRIYLEHRFGNDYCLGAESSLDLHVENPTVPQQVIVITKFGAGLRQLMHNTSLMIYVDENNFPTERVEHNGIYVMSLPYALCKAAPSYFRNQARDAELALRLIKTPADLSRIITSQNLKSAASRLVGAYEFIKDYDTANTIKNDLLLTGLVVTPDNPFTQPSPLLINTRLKSPYVGRIKAMWHEARDSVINNFPEPPGLPKYPSKYLQKIDEMYVFDAYNSLSIEGYHVTPELINRVKNKSWNPDFDEDDNNNKNALAARGYYDAFLQVKSCIERILKGENAAALLRNELQLWYKYLFHPCAQAGIISEESLFGYRNDRVVIRNSRHSPPHKDAVVDAMEAFFDCMELETNPAVNAVLGHYFFVYIHPYMDGNGRIARFLMNALLASGGYPWTIVHVENRTEYINTLEATHLEFDMTNFTKFIAAEMLVNNPHKK